jgi:prepilin-type N-terminal cleavage/methylation domain-containing protein
MPRLQRTSGFTLIEMVISIIILGVMAGLGATMLGAGFKSYFVGEQALRLAPLARNSMERIVRELRPACAAPSISGTGNIQIDFGVISSGSCAAPAARSIRLSGSTLQLQVDGTSWHTLVSGVSRVSGNSLFTSQSDPDSSCKSVQIEYQVSSSGSGNLPLRTTVFLRNAECA